MRGPDTFTESLFTMRRLDDFVPENHPLRSVRKMVNQALKNIEPLLSGMYAANIKGGRSSIAPQKLLRAMLLQILHSTRSERLLMEQTQYNLLFRWFIGLSMDDTVTRVISRARAAATTPTSPPLKLMRGYTARATRPVSCASWVTP